MSEVVASPPATASAGAAETGGHVTATRRLLRRLRGIMAVSESAQERLDRIVRVIAAEMVAEVCSAYVMRAGRATARCHFGATKLAESSDICHMLRADRRG